MPVGPALDALSLAVLAELDPGRRDGDRIVGVLAWRDDRGPTYRPLTDPTGTAATVALPRTPAVTASALPEQLALELGLPAACSSAGRTWRTWTLPTIPTAVRHMDPSAVVGEITRRVTACGR